MYNLLTGVEDIVAWLLVKKNACFSRIRPHPRSVVCEQFIAWESQAQVDLHLPGWAVPCLEGGLYETFARTSQVFGKRGSHRADKPANEEQRGLSTW